MACLKLRGSTYYAQYYLGSRQKRVCLRTESLQMAHVDQNPKRSLTYLGGNPSGFTKRAAYAYDTQASASGSGNYSRLQTLTYPDGAVQGYAYGASTSTPDSRISRATQLDLGGSPLVKYGRIGLDLFAVVDYDVPNVQLDRARAETGASKDGEYPGLDRFGRVRRQLWVDGAFAGGTGSNPNKPPIVSTLYSYSKASDRLQAVDDRPGAGQPLSQAYTYDGLHRLVEAARGDWNGSAVAVSLGSQRWRNGSGDVTLDALGNWRESWTDLDGSGTYSDTTERDDRTHDIFNRIDARTLKGQGVSGADLTMGPLGYDLASNLSSWKVQAGTSATAVAAVHDAWNRLVDVTYAGDVRTRQEYNALHWRTFRVADTSGTGADPEQARLMYYGHDWRLLQEWVDDDLDFTDWSAGSWKLTDTDRTQQYVWGLRYIDDIVLHRADRNKDGDYVDAGDGTWHHLTDAQYSSVCLVDSAATVVERVTYSAYGIARHHWATDVDGDGAVTTGTGSDFSLVSTIASDTLANRTIGGSAYRSEADLDRSGVIDATDRGLVGSAKAALALGQLGEMGNAAPDNIVGWDGYLLSAESALYTVRYRSYLPALGRWPERDPAEYQDGLSLFGAMGDSPMRFLDAMGLAPDLAESLAPFGVQTCKVGAFAGINNFGENYVRDLLFKIPGGGWPIKCSSALCEQSDLGINPVHYPGERNLILNSKEKLDREAVAKAGCAGSLCDPRGRTRIRAVMISPKSGTAPLDVFDGKGAYSTRDGTTMHKHGCCDISFTTVFDPGDPAPNQRFFVQEYITARRWIWWEEFGRTIPVYTGSGTCNPFDRHSMEWYLKDNAHPILAWRRCITGNTDPRYPSENYELVPTGSRLELADMLRRMARGSGTLFVCHSQGCNIMMQKLRVGCKNGCK